MTKVIVHGCNGKMGRMITRIVAETDDMETVAGVDCFKGIENTYPVYDSIAECEIDADVVIDFSNAGAVEKLLKDCTEKKLPVVLCTTGLSPEQIALVNDSSKVIPILRSANMSLGVNLLLKLLQQAARTLAPEGFDIEIVEKHHNQKVDAPSGTAIAMAESINEALDNEYNYTYDRSNIRRKRDKKEIGIVAVRGGNIVGQHDVIFAGEDEVIEFSHTATSRAVFAKGAVVAAAYLAGKEPGLYSMSDVIGID